MPSVEHELLLSLLRGAPSALRALLSRVLGLEVGVLVEVRASFADLSPGVYSVDLALASDEVCVLVEVQRDVDPDKLFAWPLYLASAHAMQRKPTWLVVLATERRVARWAKRAIATFQGGGFAPLVIGPDELPIIEDEAEALAAPALAVLAMLVRGREGVSVRGAKAALAAALELARADEDRGKLVLDALLDAVGTVGVELWEAAMRSQGYQYKSQIVLGYIAQGREEGRDEGARAALSGTLRALAEGFGLEWSEAREAELATLDAPHLQALVESVARHRCWPSRAR